MSGYIVATLFVTSGAIIFFSTPKENLRRRLAAVGFIVIGLLLFAVGVAKIATSGG
jgi:hypothetical protein